MFPEHWTVYLFPSVTWLLMMKDCIKFGWGQFKCASWSFTEHFCVRIYSSSQANGSLCFLFKFLWLFECGHWVHFNFKFVFSFYMGFWSCFLIFSFSFDLEVDLCLLFVACVSFFWVGIVVSFSVGLSLIFIFLWSLFWRFMLSVLMWVVASSESSVIVLMGSWSIGLNGWIMGLVHLLGVFV